MRKEEKKTGIIADINMRGTSIPLIVRYKNEEK